MDDFSETDDLDLNVKSKLNNHDLENDESFIINMDPTPLSKPSAMALKDGSPSNMKSYFHPNGANGDNDDTIVDDERRGTRDPNTFHRGKIVIPMQMDLFGDDNDNDNESSSDNRSQTSHYSTKIKPNQISTVTFQADIPRLCGGKWNAHFGTHASVNRDMNLGGSLGHISAGYLLTNNLDLQCTMELGPNSKASIQPTYTTNDKNTCISCSINTYTTPKTNINQEQMNTCQLSIQTQRYFFQKRVLGNFCLGMSPNHSTSVLRHSSISFTSLLPSTLQWTLNLDLGGKHNRQYHPPSKLTNSSTAAKKHPYNPSNDIFSKQMNGLSSSSPAISLFAFFPLSPSSIYSYNTHRFGTMELGINGKGQIHWEAILTRVISKFAKLSVGVRHLTSRGLTWLIHYERESIQFCIPITVSRLHVSTTVNSFYYYSFKVGVISVLSALMDQIIGKMIQEWNAIISGSGGQDNNSDDTNQNNQTLKKTLYSEEQLLLREKAKKDAQMQLLLMSKQAKNKKKIEEEKNGLVILSATYASSDDVSGETLDVVTQLQFWVSNSKLRLPASSKSNLLGFYDVTNIDNNRETHSTNEHETATTQDTSLFSWLSFWNGWNGWNSMQQQTQVTQKHNIAKLTVRYKFDKNIYEKKINDDEALELPCSDAVLLETNKN